MVLLHLLSSSVRQPHSVVPEFLEEWPSLDSILSFRDRVRARLIRLYEAIERRDPRIVTLGRKVGRVLWMCLEHEGFHTEVSPDSHYSLSLLH